MSEEGVGKIPVRHSSSPKHGSSPSHSSRLSHLNSSPVISSMYTLEQNQQRRPSGTFSRLPSFGIYGSYGSSGGSGSSSGSLSKNAQLGSQQFVVPATSSVRAAILPSKSFYDEVKHSTTYQTNCELLGMAKSSETPNLFAVAGNKSIQILSISENEVTHNYDLFTQRSTKSKSSVVSTKTGILTDIKFGHAKFGKHLAFSTSAGLIHLFNTERGDSIKTTLYERQRSVNSIDFGTQNPWNIISGAQGGKMKIWDLRLKNNKSILTLNTNDNVKCVQFNPRDGKVLCCILDTGTIQKWDIRKPETFERRILSFLHGSVLDWHPRLDYIVAGGSKDNNIRVWNMGAGPKNLSSPDYTIRTSGLVDKVSWCRGRGNGSIANTDIAASFQSDVDPTIQIWDLHRKTVPKYVITGHTDCITGLVWNTPRHIVSCSRDKNVLQHDVLLEPKVIDNMPRIVSAWNPSDQDAFVFIKQDRDQFEVSEIANHKKTLPQIMAHSRNSLLGGSVPKSLMNLQLSRPKTKRKSFSLASFLPLAPSFTKMKPLSHRSRPAPRPKFPRIGSKGYNALNKLSTSIQESRPPFIMNVNAGLEADTSESFEFLSENYIVEVPKGVTLNTLCTRNAAFAASVGRFRDCQTWMAIAESIELEDLKKANQELEDLKKENQESDSLDVTSDSHSMDQAGTSANGAIDDIPDKTTTEHHNSGSAPTSLTSDLNSEQSVTSAGVNADSNVAHFESRIDSDPTQQLMRIKTLRLEQGKIKGKMHRYRYRYSTGSGSVTGTGSESESRSNSNANSITITTTKQEDTSEEKIYPNESAVIDDEYVSSGVDSRSNSKNNIPNVTNTGIVYSTQDSVAGSSPAEFRPVDKIDPLIKYSRSGSNSSQTYRFSFTNGAIADLDDEKAAFGKSPKPFLPTSHLSRSTNFPSMNRKERLEKFEEITNSALKVSPIKKKTLGSPALLPSADDKRDRDFLNNSNSSSTSLGNESQLGASFKKLASKPSTLLTSKAGDQTTSEAENASVTSSPSSPDNHSLIIPWNPEDMIKEAIAYAASQGDVIMPATMILLFKTRYPKLLGDEQAKDCIYTYYEQLSRKCLFITAAKVMKLSSKLYSDFRDLGKKDTSCRLICQFCKEQIFNGESSKKHEAPNELGFWYCGKCHKVQGNCIYCNELLKGVSVVLLGCEHGGHLECFKYWFVDCGERECPGCGAIPRFPD